MQSEATLQSPCPVSDPRPHLWTDSSLPLAPPTSGAAGGAPAAQPLPSSVINKQPMTADAQYMQQQSHIFVFSTQLANKAYEAVVLQSQYPTIIAYHCSQPGTKKYLDVSGWRAPGRTGRGGAAVI